jgi:multidrug efflux pump subunit AcrB
MKSIISFAVKHPVSVITTIVAVILFGILSMILVPVDFLPVLSSRNLLVAAEYEGIFASEHLTAQHFTEGSVVYVWQS